MTTILGVETSCDETAAAVVRDGRILLSNVVSSQAELHEKYGGVFPEMASRQHMLAITPVIRETLENAGLTFDELDALAVVHGPGLSGSLLVGLNAVKALSWARDIPLIGVNHLEAHVYANWLIPPDETPETFTSPSFPLICLVVSGGHTALILMPEHHEYQLLGQTIDDASGEAFDKTARLLGLGYPGGPAIERIATEGDPTAYHFPRALSVGPFDFSFSGLKTAVLRLVQEMRREKGLKVDAQERLADATVDAEEVTLPLADIAASFQAAVVDALVEKTVAAVEQHDAVQVLLAGGVAANKHLRSEMRRRLDIPMRCPPIIFCTDNAAMVAVAGHYRYLAGERASLNLDAIPSLSLT
jgi:N6-L-threonylcarbamoyladenine synthase